MTDKPERPASLQRRRPRPASDKHIDPVDYTPHALLHPSPRPRWCRPRRCERRRRSPRWPRPCAAGPAAPGTRDPAGGGGGGSRRLRFDRGTHRARRHRPCGDRERGARIRPTAQPISLGSWVGEGPVCRRLSHTRQKRTPLTGEGDRVFARESQSSAAWTLTTYSPHGGSPFRWHCSYGASTSLRAGRFECDPNAVQL